ncbi:MAG TPA: hypothetical protein VMW24_08550, partial [Sedimentisphaerales bacterium]|nr:hypothetical protein [Sedimentisphaerales bacterium]
MQWWHIVCLVCVPLLFFIVWIITTQLYLRTGCRPKIGLAYDGHNVNIADWKRTQKTLRDLLANKHIKNRVTLRFVPPRSVLTDEYANKYMKGYGFSILTTVRQSPAIQGGSRSSMVSVPTFRVEVMTEEAERRFLQTLLPHQFLIARKVDRNLGAILNAQAVDLHNLLLLVVAAYYYLEEKYNDAAVISQHLDQSLSSTIGPTDVPRAQIRLLDMNARLRRTEFSFKKVPAYDTLVEISDFAETAMCYFDESPLVAISLSRMRFLTGDTDGAVELMQRTKSKIDEIRESGQEPISRVSVVYYLNSAFLSFIQGHWVNAYNSYDSMLCLDAYRNENWAEIINFIDYVFDLECYEGVAYLQCLYRLIAGSSATPELRNAAEDWVDKDESRHKLGYLLSRDYPSLSKKTEETIPTAKASIKKEKQRSKRKHKGR